MRENPRPTRHLEHVEPDQFGKPLPGSISGPAWDLVALPDQQDPPHPPVAGDAAPPGDSDAAAPPGSGPAALSGEASRRRPALLAGATALVVLALGAGGLILFGELRPEDDDTSASAERVAVELPFLLPNAPAPDRPTGPARQAESQPRRSEAAATGNAVIGRPEDMTAASGAQPGRGDTSAGGAGTGTEGGAGSGGGGDTGASGGTTTPTATAPPPTSAPTKKPSPRPTPRPTPTVSDEPTPDPTPSPSVSPTPEPTGAPERGAAHPAGRLDAAAHLR